MGREGYQMLMPWYGACKHTLTPQNFAETYELKFLETSSKDDINVKEAFKQLAEMILEELEK